MPRLTSKIAIVTGASSGIGRAICLAYHAEGAYVVCADLKPEPRSSGPGSASTAQETAEEEKQEELPTHEVIVQEGGKAIFVAVDVTKGAEMKGLVARAVEEWGRVDVFINNAGIGSPAAPIWEADEEAWDRVMAVNSRGVFLGTKYAAAQMVKQDPGPSGDRGWIVNFSSVLGLRGERNMADYVTSKHSVLGLTKTAALDLAPHRVHANAICPGYVLTPLTANMFADPEIRARGDAKHPFRGLGTPEDVARVAVWLGCEENSWMTGAEVRVDGGYCVP